MSATCRCGQHSWAERKPECYGFASVEAVSQSEPCPSCDRDLSYPGAPGHECYTYAEQAVNGDD